MLFNWRRMAAVWKSAVSLRPAVEYCSAVLVQTVSKFISSLISLFHYWFIRVYAIKISEIISGSNNARISCKKSTVSLKGGPSCERELEDDAYTIAWKSKTFYAAEATEKNINMRLYWNEKKIDNFRGAKSERKVHTASMELIN